MIGRFIDHYVDQKKTGDTISVVKSVNTSKYRNLKIKVRVGVEQKKWSSGAETATVWHEVIPNQTERSLLFR